MVASTLCLPAGSRDLTRWARAASWILQTQAISGCASWLSMLLAMGPLLLLRPLTASVAQGWRWLAICQFLAIYCTMWLAALLPLTAILVGLDMLTRPLNTSAFWLAGMLVVIWQFSPWKQHALDQCRGLESRHGTTVLPLPPVWQLSMRAAWGCVCVCWPWMLWSMTLGEHHRVGMLLITLILVAERHQQGRSLTCRLSPLAVRT
jgi:hypothetical protein